MHSAPLLTSLVIATVTALGHFTLSEPAVRPPMHPATPIVDMTQPPADYREPVTPTNFTATIVETKDDMHSVQLRRELPKEPHGDKIFLNLNGDRLGYLEIHRRDVIITDIPVGETIEFGLEAYNSAYDVYSDTVIAIVTHPSEQPRQDQAEMEVEVETIETPPVCIQQDYPMPPELCAEAMRLVDEFRRLLSPFTLSFIPPSPTDQL